MESLTQQRRNVRLNPRIIRLADQFIVTVMKFGKKIHCSKTKLSKYVLGIFYLNQQHIRMGFLNIRIANRSYLVLK